MFTTIIAKIISSFLAAVMTITFPINLFTGKEHERIARAANGCGVSIAVFSDTHINEKTSFVSDSMLKTGLMDLQNAAEKPDALVFDGDITDHGYIKQWDIFAKTVSQYDTAESVYLVIGNHDTWGPYEDDNYTDPVNGVLPTFVRYNKEITGRDIDRMYYSDVVNGYYFIMLGSEGDHTYADLSDAQLAWFAAEMEKAAQTKLPIFVFCHQPVNQTHGLPETWDWKRPKEPLDTGGLGAQSDAVAAILKRYDNVFYCSGHIHSGFRNEDSKIGMKYASVE